MPRLVPPASRSDRTRSVFTGLLLVVALGVTATVTYRAYQASQREKAFVQLVLHQYVTFAAEHLHDNTQRAITSCLKAWLHPERIGNEGERFFDADLADCGNQGNGRFSIDLGTGAITNAGVPGPLMRWLADTLTTNPRIKLWDWSDAGFLTSSLLPGDQGIAYAIIKRNGVPLRAVGLLTRSTGEWILNALLTGDRLAPAELADNLQNRDLFDTHLVRLDEMRAANAGSATALGPEFGTLAISVQLKRGAAAFIFPGGLPKDPTLQLLMLFFLALVMVASAMLLLRREAQLTRERAGFVSSVSHELRTPLAQIRMFAEMLLLDRVRNEFDRRRSLQIIDKEARRLSHLVDNVLQVARAERGGARVNPEQCRLAPIVRETVESFTVLSAASRIDFRVELQEDLVVAADSEAVRQIVLNLLDNAAKYGPPGQRVVVGVALFNDTARLWIDDEGPGIPVREREKVFETFYRANREVDSHTTGSGIGLAVVRELATLHGGSAWVEDAPIGARVVVEFPGATLADPEVTADWAIA